MNRQQTYRGSNFDVGWMRCKVEMPNSITYLKQTPLFPWYMVKCVTPRTETKKTCVEKRLDYMLKI